MKLKKQDFFYIVLLIFFLVFNHFFSINIVNGNSMYPTLKDKNLIINLKNCNNLKNNDIIIFKNNDKFLIKRIIGKPFDYLEIKNEKVYINNKLIKESYLKPDINTSGLVKILIPKDKYFVLGDNREISFDSRTFGLVDKKDIIGKIIFKK